MYGKKALNEIAPRKLVAVYNLADKLGILGLQNATAGLIQTKGYPSPQSAMWLWENTQEGSKLRELMLDRLRYCISKYPWH